MTRSESTAGRAHRDFHVRVYVGGIWGPAGAPPDELASMALSHSRTCSTRTSGAGVGTQLLLVASAPTALKARGVRKKWPGQRPRPAGAQACWCPRGAAPSRPGADGRGAGSWSTGQLSPVPTAAPLGLSTRGRRCPGEAHAGAVGCQQGSRACPCLEMEGASRLARKQLGLFGEMMCPRGNKNNDRHHLRNPCDLFIKEQ